MFSIAKIKPSRNAFTKIGAKITLKWEKSYLDLGDFSFVKEGELLVKRKKVPGCASAALMYDQDRRVFIFPQQLFAGGAQQKRGELGMTFGAHDDQVGA